jgi:hypothetical protein
LEDLLRGLNIFQQGHKELYFEKICRPNVIFIATCSPWMRKIFAFRRKTPASYRRKHSMGIWDKLERTALNEKYHLDNNLCDTFAIMAKVVSLNKTQ